MTARLPIPGSDNGTWGNLLNDFLGVALDVDGTLLTTALTAAGGVQIGGDIGGTATTPTVTATHLSSALPVAQGGTGSTTKNFVDLTTAQTVTNKFIRKRVVAMTDATTITPNASTTDTGTVTMAGNRTLAAPSGTPVDGQQLILRLRQDTTGTRVPTWNAIYRFSGGIAPTLTTTASKTDYFGFMYNGTDSKWDCVGYQLGL